MEVNVVDAVLFTRSYVNTVVNFTLEIPKTISKQKWNNTSKMWLKSMNDENLHSFAGHFAKRFTQKPSPQQCHKIMFFGILSTVNPLGSMKTWGQLSCAPCMK